MEEVGVSAGRSGRRRLSLIAMVLLLEIGIFFAGLFTPLSATTRQALASQTGSQFGGVQTGTTSQVILFIFGHNLPIALAEMIPVGGALVFAFSVYSTGIAAQALVAAQGLPAQWGAVILAFPYSLVELSAYAVAVVSGSLVLAAWRGHRLRKEMKTFATEVGAVVAILLVAATMETITVKVSVLLGLALWLPTGIALGTIMVVARKGPK